MNKKAEKCGYEPCKTIVPAGREYGRVGDKVACQRSHYEFLEKENKDTMYRPPTQSPVPAS